MTVHTCPNCNQQMSISMTVPWVDVVCSKCHDHYRKQADGSQVLLTKYEDSDYLLPRLEIGRRGIFNEEEWEIVGRKVSSTSQRFLWTEVFLRNAAGNYRYLSETNGSWVLSEELTKNLSSNFDSNRGIYFESEQYKLFFKDTCYVVLAEGFFEHPIASQFYVADYTAPPKALFLEKEDKVVYSFAGRHVPKKELLAAFPDFVPPEHYGVGMVQPFYFDTEKFVGVMAIFAIILLALHIVMVIRYPERKVLEGTLLINDVKNEETVSESFDLTDIRGPLTVEVHSDVDNSWVALELCLVNEKTKEERYVSNEVSYYYGPDEGGTWHEGAKANYFNICGVPPGRYHLTTKTYRDEATRASSMFFRVLTNKARTGNLMWSWGLLVIWVVLVFIIKAIFESQRWEHNNVIVEE